MADCATLTIGKQGEQIAVEYLRNRNYEIIARNYRWNRGEVDIIAQLNNMLVFVEVKTARQKSFGEPETWVDERKQQQIGMVAEHFMDNLPAADLDCRFDVIAVTIRQNQTKIKHFEDAFWL